MNVKKLIKPISVCLAGIILCAVFAPMTSNVNGGVGLGIFVVIIGTIYLSFALYKEIYRIGISTPFPLNKFFPDFPIVQDKTETDKLIHGFRDAYGEFIHRDDIEENSNLQNYASAFFWHSMKLWKLRLKKLDVSMKFESNRRKYTNIKNVICKEEYFDGRYEVCDISEEIDANRIFFYKGQEIKSIQDKEIAHYTLLSAKIVPNTNQVMCPNCGAKTTGSNLIDGCDYCGTKFNVEDLLNSISSFGFLHDFSVRESKREAVKDLVYPWIFLITEMPYVYFGFFGAFLYLKENIFAKFMTGVVAAFLFGLFGLFFVKVNTAICIPIIIAVSKTWEKFNRKLVYRSKEENEQEKNMADFVRQWDSKFSIQSFFGGIQNKLSAIHYAENPKQINAFSDCDLSNLLNQYQNVVDMDTLSLTLDSYDAGSKIQTADVSAELLLRELSGSQIFEKKEHVKMRFEKSAWCKHQAVCGPSVLKCKNCGASISLMEGKRCEHCESELDLKQYDWVITKYSIEK